MTISNSVRVRFRLRAAFFLMGISSLCGVPSIAHADNDEQKAIVFFDKGRKLAREGRCADAIAPLLESIRYAEGVGPLLNLGACYETIGKSASAYRYFSRAQEVATQRDDRRRDEAAQRAKGIEKELSMLVVQVPSSLRASMSTEIKVDGENWPRERWGVPAPIDPGPHEMEVVAPPHPKHTEMITVRAKNDRVEWTAPLPDDSKGPSSSSLPAKKPSPKDDATPSPMMKTDEEGSSTQRTFGLVTGGVGVASLLVGAVFGVISISAHSSVVGRCPNYPRCDVDDKADLDQMNANAQRSGDVATIGVVAGAVLLVGGAALFFTAPSSSASSKSARSRFGSALFTW